MLFVYTLRNLWARRRSLAPMLLSIAGAVAGAVLARANIDSLFQSVLSQAEPRNAIVVARDATTEAVSAVPHAVLPRLAVSEGVAHDGNEPLFSAEGITNLLVFSVADEPTHLWARGVDPIAFRVHPKVHMTAGRKMERGEQAVIIGSRLVGKYRGLVLGGEVQVGRNEWKVVGVFDGNGTAHESEIWMDRSASDQALHFTEAAIVAVTLADRPDALAILKRDVERVHEHPLRAEGALDFLHESLVEFEQYRATSTLFTSLLMLGCFFACGSAMYTSVLGRRREIATLIAIGFTRTRISVLLISESTIFAVLGGVVGLSVSLAFAGTDVAYSDARSYPLLVTPAVLLSGVVMSLGVGVVGGLVGFIESRRIDVTSALRG